MFRHHLTIALRTLRRDRGYALLNGVGLAVALACCLLVGLFVRAEKAVDTFHPDVDRLRAVWMDSHWTAESTPGLSTPVPLAEALEANAAIDKAVVVGPGAVQGVRVTGRVSPAVASDAETGVLLNAAGARALGWTPAEAVGQAIETQGRSPGEVVGVVADYAHHGLTRAVGPQVFFEGSGTASWAIVRTAPGARASAGLAAAWRARAPEVPFAPEALALAVEAQYRPQERLARAFGLFSGLALVVAALGLFGLAAYAVQQRRKEVGVRKVLGATVGQIVARLTADFARPVLVGFVLAVPVAAWALSRWLDGFASRVALGPVPFLVAGVIAVAVAVATVSRHTLRAASAEPARSLRSE